MSESNNAASNGVQEVKKGRWVVILDKTKCSLCEVCASHCPTEALIIEKEDAEIKLLFNQADCIGCTGEQGCVTLCPEDALVLNEAELPDPDDPPRVLAEGELIKCQYCREYYTSNARLNNLVNKGLGHDVDTTYCPLCRRTNLVVHLIEHKIAPGKDAMYRSTRDILRRARFKRFEEKSGDSEDVEEE